MLQTVIRVPVRVWIGQPAEEGYEQSALKELAADLADESDMYHLLANFAVGTGRESAQIDILVIHGAAWTIVELKHSAAYAVFGSSNGPWKRSDGMEFPGGNPALQVVRQYSALARWLYARHLEFVDPGREAACDDAAAWTDICKFIALYPCKHPASKIDVSAHIGLTGTLGAVIGFDLLKAHLLEPKWQCRLRMPLFDREIAKLAGVLGLSEVTPQVLGSATHRPMQVREQRAEGTRPPEDGPPAAPNKRRFLHDKRLMLGLGIPLLCAAVAIAVAFALGVLHLRSPSAPETTPGPPAVTIIEAPDAWNYIGSPQEVSVRITIGSIDPCGYGQDSCIYDRRIAWGAVHNFSLEVNGVGGKQLPFGVGDVIVVGPSVIGESGGKPPQSQITVEYDDLSRLVHVESAAGQAAPEE